MPNSVEWLRTRVSTKRVRASLQPCFAPMSL
jgi:hypothetical protein